MSLTSTAGKPIGGWAVVDARCDWPVLRVPECPSPVMDLDGSWTLEAEKILEILYDPWAGGSIRAWINSFSDHESVICHVNTMYILWCGFAFLLRRFIVTWSLDSHVKEQAHVFDTELINHFVSAVRKWSRCDQGCSDLCHTASAFCYKWFQFITLSFITLTLFLFISKGSLRTSKPRESELHNVFVQPSHKWRPSWNQWLLAVLLWAAGWFSATQHFPPPHLEERLKSRSEGWWENHNS